MIDFQRYAAGNSMPLIPTTLLTLLAMKTDQIVSDRPQTLSLVAAPIKPFLNELVALMRASTFSRAIYNARFDNGLSTAQAVGTSIRSSRIAYNALIVEPGRARLVAELVLALFKGKPIAAAEAFWRSGLMLGMSNTASLRKMGHKLRPCFLYLIHERNARAIILRSGKVCQDAAFGISLKHAQDNVYTLKCSIVQSGNAGNSPGSLPLFTPKGAIGDGSQIVCRQPELSDYRPGPASVVLGNGQRHQRAGRQRPLLVQSKRPGLTLTIKPGLFCFGFHAGKACREQHRRRHEPKVIAVWPQNSSPAVPGPCRAGRFA